ncbi:MAG: hypothetical protein ACKO96_35320 [Flammeovirgaceae bacterium]
MKRLSFILLTFIYACSTDTKGTFPIDIVVKNSFKQQDKLHIGDLGKYKQIDTSFLKKWFEGLPIPERDNEKLKCDHYSYWYFIDHRQIDDKVVFQY